jgi:hypothetical protein
MNTSAKLARCVVVAFAMTTASVAAQAQAVIDTIQAPTGFFVPTDAQKFDAPYYRGFGGDWGWTHNAILGVTGGATLQISAFDVDFAGQLPQFTGERDEIFAWNSGAWESLGFLVGENDAWAFTNFVLGPQFYDDIAAGLQVRMAIDTTEVGWLVTLAKSSLSIDTLDTNPNPSVPLGPASPLFAVALGALALLHWRRKRNAQANA